MAFSLAWLPDALTLRSLEKLLQSAEHRFRMENCLSKLGELMAFRVLLALRQSNRQAAITYAKEALDWFAQAQSPMQGEQRIWRGLSLSVMAEEWIGMGHFQQARTALLEAHALCEAMENHYFKRAAMTNLARVCFELGEFQQARSLYRQVLAEARAEEHRYARCNALIGLATLCYVCNELESANQHAQEVINVSQSHQLLHYEVRATLILARIQQAQGQIFVAHVFRKKDRVVRIPETRQLQSVYGILSIHLSGINTEDSSILSAHEKLLVFKTVDL